MNETVRTIVAFTLAIALEFGFIKTVELIREPPQKEVKEVIKISLIKKRETEVKVKREVPKKKKVKEEKRKSSVKTKPKITSKKPQKKLPKNKKEGKREKPGGLKPLQGNLPASYIEAIKNAIEENIFYPLEAIERGEEGVVSVKFVLSRNGKVLKCSPLKGESKILQEATCIAIKRAKFPPFPKEIKNKKITFQLEIEYNLEQVK